MEPGSVLLSHGIPRTIIGAEAFHGPVRDGKAWDHLAMAARQSFVFFALNKLEEVFYGSFDCVFSVGKRLGLRVTNTQGYRIKPHGQLVSVSSTHYCACTPDLSTL